MASRPRPALLVAIARRWAAEVAADPDDVARAAARWAAARLAVAVVAAVATLGIWRISACSYPAASSSSITSLAAALALDVPARVGVVVRYCAATRLRHWSSLLRCCVVLVVFFGISLGYLLVLE